MSFFRIDDSFYDHPKLIRLEAVAGEHYAAAIALWTFAGCWAAKHGTDGRVQRLRLHRLAPFDADQVNGATNALIEVGLWELDGDEVVYHDWSAYQLSAEEERRNHRAAVEERARAEEAAEAVYLFDDAEAYERWIRKNNGEKKECAGVSDQTM